MCAQWFTDEFAQPFRVEVDPLVHVLLDVHSHLMATEVIGLLGGCFDNDKKLLRILSAHPCRTLGTGNDHLNVELDPVSQIEVVEAIANAKQQTVGWYHSHPVFRNDPSVIDVQNQMSYQSLFHGSANSRGGGDHSSCTPTSLRSVGGLVPFVAAICTPFGSHDFRPLPSSIKYFSTINAKERKRLDSRMRGSNEPRKKAAGTEEGDDRAYRPEGKNGGGASAQSSSKRTRKMGSGDALALEDPVDTAVELWTSVKRSFPRKNSTASAAAAAATTTSSGPSTASIAAGQAGFVTPPVTTLLPVLQGLVSEYSSLAHRVNFRRRWQPNDYALEEEEESEEDASEEEDEEDEGEPEEGEVRQPKKGAAARSDPPGRGRSIADLASSKPASSSSAAASSSSAAAASKSKKSIDAASFDADDYDDGVGGDDSAPPASESSSSEDRVLPSSYIRTKLDQFIHSLSGHLLALESDGTKKSAHVLSTTGMRSTAAFDGGAVDESISPFLQALRPEHQAFVKQITKMVEGWKDGDEGEDQSEEDEEEEQQQKPAPPPKQQKKKPAAAASANSSSAAAASTPSPAAASKSAPKAASKSAAAKPDSSEPKPRGKPGPKPKPKPPPAPASSTSDDNSSPPAAAASSPPAPDVTVTGGPVVQRVGKRASPPSAIAAAAIAAAAEKAAAASSRKKRNDARQMQAAAAAASPPAPSAEDLSDLPDLVAMTKANYPASPTPPSPPPKKAAAAVAAAAAAQDAPFESSPTF